MLKMWVKTVLVLFGLGLTACSTIPAEENRMAMNSEAPVVNLESNDPSLNPPTVNPPPAPDQVIQEVNQITTPVTTEPLGGSIEKYMDNNDKIKMSRALDKAPGKVTTWENKRTQITYSVIPIKKVIVQDNPFCREYQIKANKQDRLKEMSGIACVAADGNWHMIDRI